MKRLGLLAILVVGLVLGMESFLALIRQRTVNVTLQLQDSTSTASASAGTPATPDPTKTLSMLPDGTVLALINWNYHIGPRFPLTKVHAVVLDNQQKPVASDDYQIDCGTETIDCTGSATLSLNYGILEKAGSKTAWPTGTYTVQVTRAYGDLTPTQIVQQTIQIVGQ